MKRRFTLLAIATFVSTSLMAAWDGTTKTAPSGGGSEGDPYLIATEANLAWIADQIKNQSTDGTYFSGVVFKQTEDLDLANKTWTPIGNNKKLFGGTYDGNGKVITNLNINAPTADYKALFGGIDNATLKNITVASGFVYGKQYSAGICGYAKGESEITCCANIATVYGKQERNGGVVAYIEGETKVNNCINYGLISAFNYSGGVVGFCNVNTTEVSNCINVGQVFGMRYTVGNCFGYNKDFGCPTAKCFYDNQINASEGWTRVNPIESDLDEANKMEGKPTSVMISGNKLDNSFSNDYWVFTSGMYPRLKTNYEQPAVILAATPVSLASGDNADNVTKNFTVSTDNNVTWTSGNTSNLTISGKNASILKSTGLVLTATKDGYSKKVYLKSNKTGATAIGSSSSPLTIEDKSELEALRDAVNNYGVYKGCANYDGFKDVHFKVTVDIELTDWTEPIGIHNSFKGVFDGNHRSIKGINVAQTSYSSVGGLFGCLSYGEVKNITVYGSVKGKELIGGICGATFNEQMTNCISYCTIDCSGKAQVGGIAGDDRGFSTFTNCENHGAITAGTRSGGILGRSQMGTTLDGCKNFGDVNGNDESVGGICGSVPTTTGGGTITNCENHGKVESSSDKGKIGGIIGSVPTNATELVTLTNCINTGIVDGKYAGGIIGHAKNKITLSDCLNIGQIKGTTVGGIIGFNESPELTLSDAFNAGETAGAGIISSLGNGSTCDKCINIGKTADAKYCIYDYQMCPVGSTGKLTTEMLGNALKNDSDLGSNNTHWTFTDGMYPMITALKESDYMKVAATPINLYYSNDPNNLKVEDVNGVTKTLNYDKNSPVEWECSKFNNEILVSFVGGKGYISNPSDNAEVVLTAIKGDAKKEIKMTIKKSDKTLTDPEVELTLTPTSIDYGTPIDSASMIHATNNHGTGHWECSVKDGEILHANDHIITATFIPDDLELYAVKTAYAVLSVNKGDAADFITWKPATSITYGDEDSDEKLKNATATVDGKFYYNIEALTVGNRIMELEFYGTNYETKTPIQKTVTVNAAIPAIAWAEPAAIDYGTPLSALQLGAVSGVKGSFKYYNGIIDNEHEINIDDVLNAGEYTLIAVFKPESNNYKENVSDTVPLTVKKLKPEITWKDDVTFAEITYGGYLTNDFAAEVPAEFNDKGSIVYLENNQPINLWDENNPVSAGTHTITAQFEPSDPNYDTNTAVATVKINKATPVITWLSTDEERTVKYGTPLSTTQLNASVEPADAGTVRFALDAAGTNDAMGASDRNAGTCAVYAIIDESDNYNAAQTSKDIVINKADLTINWNPQGFTYGATSEEMANAVENAEVSFKGQKIEDGNFVYSYPSTLNAGKDQTVSVRFVPNSSNFNTVETTETIDIAKADPVLYWLPGHVTYGATDEDIENIIRVGWAIYNFVFVDGDYDYDIPQPLNVGIYYGVNLTFTPTGNDTVNFNSVKTTATIYVDKADPTITWTPSVAEITYGTTLSADQLNAEFSPADAVGEFVYTEGEDTIVASTILDAGTHTITATLPESSNYNAATATATIVVSKAESVITWETPAAIAYGTPISAVELNATANVDGIFTYTLNGENAEGLTPEVGSYTIIANFTPTSTNYSGNSASVTLKVVSATAEITWATPAAITYGTPISSAQLNATANTEGEFTYSVREGDVLAAGEDSIFVKFTPNSPDYGRATDTVILVVNKANLTVSVADVTIKQGEALPAFELTYSGFVNNENESALTTAPVATCNATGAEVGTFDIIVSGGESANYNIEYKKGKLTVTAKEDDTAIADSEVKISVYPNPTADVFFVETETDAEYIYVYNMAGKLVVTEANVGKTRIDLANEPQGTYFVKVGEKTIKLVKF